MGEGNTVTSGRFARRQQPRAAVWMTRAEAEAVMEVLLQAPPSPEVPAEMTERLLCRVAQAQRVLCRADARRGRVRRRRRATGVAR